MQSNSQSNLVIQQLLHGYDDGHSLIAASINLDPEIKRVVGLLSDMSGPNMQKGFEEYITGYPLRDFGMYAISKTWYASEMPRPGSVWTQTLLISFADLPKIRSSVDILECFHRPSIKEKKFEVSYSDSITISRDFNFSGTTDSSEFTIETYLPVISALYEDSNNSVIVKAKNSRKYENLVLSIWLQQWPRLRRQFSFCTGAIYPRSLDNRFFDLQVSPERIESSYNLNSNFTVIDLEKKYSSNLPTEWSLMSAKDLQKPSDLRDFLRQYGADEGSTRASFINLVNSFICLIKNENRSLGSLISALSILFPKKSDAETLKSDLLLIHKDSSIRSFLPSYKEEDILFELSITKFHESFDYDKLSFSKRFESIFINNPSSVFEILDQLVNTYVNPFGELALKQIAQLLNVKDLMSIDQKYQNNLLLVFASLNPKLSYTKDFWLDNTERQAEIISILTKYNKQTEIDWQKIIAILIEINSDIDLDLLASKIDISSHILNWVNSNEINYLSYYWQNILRNKSKSVLKWLGNTKQLKGNTISTIISVLDPNSLDVIDKGSKIWLQLLTNTKTSADYYSSLQIKAFALALAFNRPDEHSWELLTQSFEVVYKGLLDYSLSYASWQPIELHTKPLSFWNDWDKCKKLIISLHDKFPDIKWTKKQIASITSDKNIAELILFK